jgi:hypothetical protein
MELPLLFLDRLQHTQVGAVVVLARPHQRLPAVQVAVETAVLVLLFQQADQQTRVVVEAVVITPLMVRLAALALSLSSTQ